MAKDSAKTIVYSALEVANICGVVNQTAINWIRNGHLPAFSTPGGQYRVYLDDLIQFMQNRKMRVPADLLAVVEQTTKNRTVLIVDDDQGLNSIVKRYLEKNFTDLEVLQAYDGFEAGALMANKTPRCVLLDLDIPGIDGFELCRRIKSSDEFGNPFVIVITALQQDGLETRVKEMGADRFFLKPLHLDKVSEIVYNIIK